MRTLIQWHRWLGVLACAAVLIFASSGLLHPLLSRTQPQPAQFQPPALATVAATPLAAVLQQNGIAVFTDARLVAIGGQPAYRIATEAGAVHYFDAADGTPLGDGERRHAEALARHFSGDKASTAARIELVTAFDDDYLANNRLLPVWRVRFERADGLTAYVDTAGQRLATLVDARKRPLQSAFRLLHNFGFLDALPALKFPVMLVLLFAAFSTALAGVVMAVRLPGNRRLRPARRWHRRAALAVAVTTFSFSVSGGWHLLEKQREPAAAPPLVHHFRSDELGPTQPAVAFSLLRVDGRPCYRLPTTAAPAGHHHHAAPEKSAAKPPPAVCVDATDGSAVNDADRRAALALARHFARSDAAAVDTAAVATEPVTRFGGEYGFINKRLPVWKIEFEGSGRRWYVEPASGALALAVDDQAALAGWVFAYFHKWSFFKEGWQDLRDLGLMAFALGNIAVALLGLTLLLRRGAGRAR